MSRYKKCRSLLHIEPACDLSGLLVGYPTSNIADIAGRYCIDLVLIHLS